MTIEKFETHMQLPEYLCTWPASLILSSAATFCKALAVSATINKIARPVVIRNILLAYLTLHWHNDKGLARWLTEERAWRIWSLCDEVDYSYTDDE